MTVYPFDISSRTAMPHDPMAPGAPSSVPGLLADAIAARPDGAGKTAPLRLLFVGPDEGTSGHRYRALRRLGHEVHLVDPITAVRGRPFLQSWGFKSGYLGLERFITRYVVDAIGSARFDAVWVEGGEWMGPRLARALKERAGYLVVNNLDNPFTARDGRRWRLLLKALPIFDLFVTPRQSSRSAAMTKGARRALAVMFTADERVHRRVVLTPQDEASFGSEVAFIGTWMPERGPFMVRLLERGVPLRILGPRWTKAPEYPTLAPVVRSAHLDDTQYVTAVSGAKIAIGLLSIGNQDLHTTRSLEIPAIGTLLCAQRTSDHEAMYRDGEEAIFFDNADHCADLCLALLADPARREGIAAAGHARAARNGWFNERLCAEVLAAATGGGVSPHG